MFVYVTEMPMVAQARPGPGRLSCRSLPGVGTAAGVTRPCRFVQVYCPAGGVGFTNRLPDRQRRGRKAEGGKREGETLAFIILTAPLLGFYFCASFYYAFIIIFEQSQKLFNFINGPPNTHTYTHTLIQRSCESHGGHFVLAKAFRVVRNVELSSLR